MPIKMSLLQLQSFLLHHQALGEPALAGAEVSVCDLEWELEQPNDPEAYAAYLDEARARLANQHYDLVAISCWSSLKYRLSLSVAEILREINPDVRIVVGGWHPSALPSDFLFEGSPFDWVITSEGEWALLELIRQLSAAKSPEKGVIRGRLVAPEEEVKLRWDAYPGGKEVPTAPLFFSRGCPFVCNYCMEPYTKGQSWRAMAPDKAVERVAHLMDTTSAKYIDVHDPIFGPQRAWRRGFFAGLKTIGFDRFMWTESRVDVFQEEDLATFAQFDFQLDFGMESAAPEMLEIMAKTRSPGAYLKRARESLLGAAKHNLTSQVYLITNHPGERMRHVKESLAFFKSGIDEMGSTSIIQLSAQPYRYYPGTAVNLEGERFKELYGTRVDRPFWWREDSNMRDASACTVDTHVSESERSDIAHAWEEGLAGLNERLLYKRSDRASRVLALRSAGFLDLVFYRERWKQARGEG